MAEALPVALSRDNTCEITGIVAAMKNVEKSPWDNTPSTMAVTETHILVSIQGRQPRSKNAPQDSPCNAAFKKNEFVTYKLCSSTRPRIGSRIRGTEGGATGSLKAVRCLFDLAVLDAPGKTTIPPAP